MCIIVLDPGEPHFFELLQDFFLIHSNPVKHISEEAYNKKRHGIEKEEPPYKARPDLTWESSGSDVMYEEDGAEEKGAYEKE